MKGAPVPEHGRITPPPPGRTSFDATDDVSEAAAAAAVARFTEAFDRHDVEGVMAAMTEDCVFESTAPPDGGRHEGHDAVRAAWTAFFRDSADAVFEAEEQIISGDRVIVLWRYSWTGGHVRGVDVFRVRGGLVAEKLSYVKG
jgi:ketosteroid isomerase-like protein